LDRATLLGIAKHFETGETLSEEIYQKLLDARTFRAASQTLRQVNHVVLPEERDVHCLKQYAACITMFTW
jgi:oligopeptidase A